MNIRDLSTLERTATWLEVLITLCQPRGRLCDVDRKLVADVSRKALALQKSLQKLTGTLVPPGKGGPP